jgi:hypothetical protein
MRTPTHRSPSQTTPDQPLTSVHVRQRRAQHRPEVLHAIANGTRGLTWSPPLLHLLLEELHVGDDFDRLVGSTRGLGRSLYPQVIAIALLLRHSWSKQDLAETSQRLKLPQLAAAMAVSTTSAPTHSMAAVPASVGAQTPRSSGRRSARTRKERSR